MLFDRLDAAQRRFAELSFDGLTTAELLDLLERRESICSQIATVRYELINPFTRRAGSGERGG